MEETGYISEVPKSEQVPKSYLEVDFRELSLLWEDYEDPKGDTPLESVVGKLNHIYRCDWPSLAGRRPPEISVKALAKAIASGEDYRKRTADAHTESDQKTILNAMTEEVLYTTVKEAIDELSDMISEVRRLA